MMLSSMFFVTITLLAAGARLLYFVRKPNWLDAILSILFLCLGIYYQLALVGKVGQIVQAVIYV